ncbi:hypothetical protein [Agromyces badenianii]|uniref:hypothetical protein n=1 Tax=Agromyces badenianii TaxID=2080742 RepID=UPI000D59714A|nr:hypothetical protein [Agromyces badenianii]PWC04303.1 hypothetical protein DCE94_09135 [Agromyces badenianii]
MDAPGRGRQIANRATAALVVVSVLLIVVAALVAPQEPGGVRFSAAQVYVWASNDADGAIGRVNTLTSEFDAALSLDVGKIDLAQSPTSVLVIDREIGSIVPLDPATLEFGDAVRLPSKTTVVALIPAQKGNQGHRGAGTGAGTERVALLAPNTGRLWITPADRLSKFDRSSPPSFEFGEGAAMVVDAAGELIVASPRDGSVYRVGDDHSERIGGFEPSRGSASMPVQVSATSAGWAVLDPRSKRLFSSEGMIDLGHAVSAGAELALQHVAVGSRADAAADPGRVLVATSSELLAITATGEVRVLARVSGDPAKPLSVGGCGFAAWSDGNDWSQCAESGDRVAGDARPRTTAAPVSRRGVSGDEGGGGFRGAAPIFRANGGAFVLNDPTTGEVWNVTADGAVPVSWAELLGENNDAALALEPGMPSEGGPDSPPARRAPPSTTAPDAPAPPGSGAQNPESQPSRAVASGPQREPLQPSGVGVVVDAASGTISLDWPDFGSAAPVLGYFAQRLAPGEHQTACSVASTGAVTPPTGDVLDVGRARSAIFGGAPPPDGGYRFVVWGYTATACAGSEAVTVLPAPVPSAVADVGGAMTWVGTRYEYRIAPAGGAALYELQRLDTEREPVGEPVVFSGAAVPRELTGDVFGEPVVFRLRACTVWGADAACGPWSEHAAPQPSLDFTLPGLVYSEERGEWTWVALPDNAGQSARVLCMGRSGPAGQVEIADGYCRTGEAFASGDAILRVRIAGVVLDIVGSDR